MRDGAWGIVYFPTYEKIREQLYKNKEKEIEILRECVAMSTSASVATLSSSLFDAIRLHQQREHSPSLKRGHTFNEGFRMSIRPNFPNLFSTVSGIMRVSVTVTLGHLSYLLFLSNIGK